MSRAAFGLAFAAGAAALAWIAGGHLGSPLTLAMTALIAAAYAAGTLELRRHRRGTQALAAALAAPPEGPATLPAWLATVPEPLRPAVQRRLEGERPPLPGPALAPYLVGLLVLLGMLGTFGGLVLTLRGATLALQGSADLAAMRAALGAPVQGLGLAFGASLAGVAASAALGLMLALARREQAEAAQTLDRLLAGALAPCTRAAREAAERAATAAAEQAQREAAQAAQAQALQALAQALEAQTRALQAQAEAQRAGQDRFHAEAQRAYAGLAESVQRSLDEGLRAAVREAAGTVAPVAEAVLGGLARETAAAQARQRADTQTLLQAQVQAQQAAAAALLAGIAEAQAAQHSAQTEAEGRRLAAWQQALDRSGEALQQGWQAATAAAAEQQARAAQALEASAAALHARVDARAQETLAQLARFVETAAAAPRAAAEIVERLRGQLSDSLARDNALLAERERLLAGLAQALDTMNRSTAEQQAALQGLVAATGSTLQAGTARLDEAAERLAGGAIEVGALAEAFGAGVARFGAGSEALLAQLQKVEAALDRAATRGDEQLAYHVAQAREVVDLCLASQRQLMAELQRVAAA